MISWRRAFSQLAVVAVVVVPCAAFGGYFAGSSDANLELERERALRVEAEEERDRWTEDAITHRVAAIDWQLCSRGEREACEKAEADQERRRPSDGDLSSWGRP